jgi:hypothetical protein
MTGSGNLAFWEANGVIKVIKLNKQAFFGVFFKLIVHLFCIHPCYKTEREDNSML